MGSVAANGLATAEVRSEWRRVGRYCLHARRSAVAPRHPQHPVVLAHGLVASSRYMTPLIERLGVHFPVACPDLPGFGRSDKPHRVLSIGGLAEALVGWMDAAGLERAVVLGNSLGCQIAVEAALRHADRIEALVLQGLTPDPSRRSGRAKVLRLLANSALEKSVGIGPVLDYLQAGPWRAVVTARHLLNDPIEYKLPRVSAPALVVRGARDPILSQGWAEKATALLPRGELRVVPGGRHTMVTVAALELTRLTVPFVLKRSRLEDLLSRPVRCLQHDDLARPPLPEGSGRHAEPAFDRALPTVYARNA